MPLPIPAPSEDASPGERLDAVGIFPAQFRYIWGTLRRLGVHDRDLEDVTHEVFLRVQAQKALYDPERPLRPWLFRLALDAASNYRRLARHRVRLAGDLSSEPDTSGGAEEELQRREERALVHAALQRLPLEQRAVLMLHEIDGYPIPEVADALGIAVNTAYSRLRLGRSAFRDHARRLLRAQGDER